MNENVEPFGYHAVWRSDFMTISDAHQTLIRDNIARIQIKE